MISSSPIVFGPQVCTSLAEGGDREWLVADGLGGDAPGAPPGRRVRLAVHEWAEGAISPSGHEFLERFDLDDGLPRWRWRVGDVVVEREIAMQHGRPSIAVVHRLVAGGPVRLDLE